MSYRSTTDFLVFTRKPPPNHDSGSWTEHRTKEDALDCATEVGGKAYRRVRAVTPHGERETIYRIFPKA